MKNMRLVFAMLFVAAVMGLVAMPAMAQPQQGDPPGVAGRLSFMQGPVSMQPGGVDDWVDATLNRPLTTSDRLWADQGGRAEVSMGNVKARIDQQTSMTIVNLDDQITQLQLDQGTLFVHVRRLFQGESVEIDTPNVAFVMDREGDYRFDVDPNADTTYVSVRRGDGEGTGEAAGVHVRSGEQATFAGGQSGLDQMAQLGDPDDFDQWNAERDRHQDNTQSARYVSPGMVGTDDLDDNGAWSEDPQYGPIWHPRVAAGWAPYHQGHWAWIDPWGYTWVDDAPWGFAPFHYGRWVSVGGGWAWAPGRPQPVAVGVAYVRPVYAPALVAFIGGHNWGVSIGVGGGGGPVGWVPLSYGEPYYPSYHVSPNYVRNVNVTNTHITNITNVTNNYTVINNNNTTVINNNNKEKVVYRNASVAGAVTAVPANAMASGRSVNQVAVKVDPKQMEQARFSAGPSVAPTKAAVLGGKAPATQHTPPAAAMNRPVMTKAAPPPAPVKFDAKQQLLQKSDGRPLTQSQVATLPKVQRPAAMEAGKPRPAAAVQQIKAAAAAAPKNAPAFHPPAAKPAPGAVNNNAGKPGTPATPANVNKPGTPAGPANAGKPNVATPPNGRPTPEATPRPGANNTPANPANRPTTMGPGGDRNVAHPPTSNPSTPAKPNETATPAGRPVPHPPTAQPARPETTTPARPNNPSAESNTARPPEHAVTPNRPTPQPQTAVKPPAHAEPHTTQTPATRTPPPPQHETNVPRPPDHNAAPAQHTPPPKQPAKDNNKDNKDNKDDKQPKLK
ncbi:DUF6600 domain-containing protein [Candidatus Korobacter versatilis]|nr:DUF6600 domain-containing protein [Candidatus Koribacter versatilis]